MALPVRRKKVKIDALRAALEAHEFENVAKVMEGVAGADIAPMLTTLDEEAKALLLQVIFSSKRAADIFAEMPDKLLADLLGELSIPRILTLLQSVEVDDAFDIYQEVPEEFRLEVDSALPAGRLQQFKRLQQYSKHSVGRRMDPDFFAIGPTVSTDDAIARVRAQVSEEQIFYIYVIDETQHLLGVVSMRQLVSSPSEVRLQDIMTKTPVVVRDTDDADIAAKLVADYHYLGLPVVNNDGKLVGMIRVDDVIDIINEEATKDIYQMFGLSIEDRVFSTPLESIVKRLPWMVINLATVFLASWVVGLFENSIEKVVALATFMPIVAGMGGNGGTQTLTVVTRGLALGEFAFTQAYRAILKEIFVGISIGAITGLITAGVVWIWKGNPWLGFVLFVAMILNMMIAGFTGTAIPLLLRTLKQDPAIGGGVIMTTFTDVFGFLTFLGIATLLLKYLV